jgi:DNA-binding CsgD family transcriptional regulator
MSPPSSGSCWSGTYWPWWSRRAPSSGGAGRTSRRKGCSPGQLLALGERFSLSGREREIAGLHAQGYSSKEIGEKLFIAPKTARNHISNIYGKTNVGRRRELLSLLRDGGESPGG